MDESGDNAGARNLEEIAAPERRDSKSNFRYAFSRDPEHPFQNKSMPALK